MYLEFILIAFILLILYSTVVQKSRGLLFAVSTTILFFVVPPDVVLVGGKYTPATIILVFSLVFLFFFKSNYHSLKTFPLLKIYIIYIISLFIIGISDLDTSFSVNVNITILYILNTAFPFILFYTIFNKNKNFSKYFDTLVVLFFVINIYGIYSYVTKTNPISTTFSETFKIRDIANDYLLGTSASRQQQISSVFFHPYMFSILLFFILLYLFTLLQNKEDGVKSSNKKIIIILIVLSFMNVYFAGSRTSYVIILFGLFFVMFSSYKSLSKLVLVVPITIILALQVPQINDMADSVLDVFSSGTTRKTEGSSLEMREQQFLISLKYLSDHPYFGNGIYSIIKKIGYTTELSKRTSDADAFGFESFIFVLLIEQGIIGLLIHILLFYHIIRYHVKNMARSVGVVKNFIRFNLIFIVGYLIYILGTGTINTLPIFFAFMGISVAYQKNYCVPRFPKN